jgi:hypothetical protein
VREVRIDASRFVELGLNNAHSVAVIEWRAIILWESRLSIISAAQPHLRFCSRADRRPQDLPAPGSNDVRLFPHVSSRQLRVAHLYR